MSSLRVAVTAEHIAEGARDPDDDYNRFWAVPVERALSELTRQYDVVIDGGGPDGPCVATIGQGAWTLVIDLPPPASEWLDRRWDHGAFQGEPFEFDLEVPEWIVALVARAATTDEQAAAVMATEVPA